MLILSMGVVPYLFYILSMAIDFRLGHPQGISYPPSINQFAAAFSALVGVFWILWGYSYLHFVGKGTPIEAFGMALYPTRFLVTTGPYAYTRNPMVFGLLFVLLAVAFYSCSISGLVMVPVIALIAAAYIRAFEEPHLERRFGAEYAEYRKNTPLLIPIRRNKPSNP
jgi:protein-S-isoprenylcysteine O-methyltransferase Ste14